MSTLYAEVEKNLRMACGLVPDRQIVVGVSGGPDSMCLLDILAKSEYPPVIAHLDHQIRPSSAADEAFVRQQSALRGLQFWSDVADVPGYAAENHYSLEEAARLLRYRFLLETARKYSAQAVAVGHTADDQVETVLMHLVQGAGLKGLGGMTARSFLPEFSRETPVVRPLLTAWRTDILAYCEKNGLPSVEDSSNEDPAFTRNRVRKVLIPLLETFNPQVRKTIWRMSQVLTGEAAINREALDHVWQSCLVQAAPDFLVFQRKVWLDQGAGYQRGLLRRGLAEIGPAGQGLGFRGVEAALEFIAVPASTFRETRLGQLRLVCNEGEIWLLGRGSGIPGDDFPAIAAGTFQQIDIPGRVDLARGWRVGAQPVQDLSQAKMESRENRDPYRTWIDAGQLDHAPLCVRTRRPGDRLQPLGMGGRSQKLSDFMINVKMPQRARAHWPLVTAGDELVWVPGYRLADPFRLTDQTETCRLSLFG